MKRIVAVVVAALVGAAAAWAGSWTATYALGASGTVGLTNTQANSSWVPVSVMWGFSPAGTGTAEVWRVSQAHSFKLANCTFSNVSSVVWVPDAAFPFGFGEALVLKSSVTTGVVQVIRRGE